MGFKISLHRGATDVSPPTTHQETNDYVAVLTDKLPAKDANVVRAAAARLVQSGEKFQPDAEQHHDPAFAAKLAVAIDKAMGDSPRSRQMDAFMQRLVVSADSGLTEAQRSQLRNVASLRGMATTREKGWGTGGARRTAKADRKGIQTRVEKDRELAAEVQHELMEVRGFSAPVAERMARREVKGMARDAAKLHRRLVRRGLSPDAATRIVAQQVADARDQARVSRADGSYHPYSALDGPMSGIDHIREQQTLRSALPGIGGFDPFQMAGFGGGLGRGMGWGGLFALGTLGSFVTPLLTMGALGTMGMGGMGMGGMGMLPAFAF